MTDNITLPRKHIDYAAHALEHFNKDAPDPLVSEIIHHLRTALAAPRLEVTVDPRLTAEEAVAISAALAAEQPKPEPVADEEAPRLWAWIREEWSADCGPWYEVIRNDQMTWRDRKGWTPLYTATPALAAEPQKHPGYIIGSHWLETAYSRICAGEAEEEVLRDCGWRRCAVGQGLTQYCAEAEALRREE